MTECIEISSEKLRSFVQRIERLNKDKDAVSEDIRNVYGEAKSTGFDAKIIRKIVALRKQRTEDRRMEEELIDLYKTALKME